MDAMHAEKWGIQHAPAAATQATITKAARPGFRHVAKSITVALTGSAAGTINVVLRDGATGAGTILWQTILGVVAASGADHVEMMFDLPGTAGNAMTLETVGAPAAGLTAVVSLVGEDWPA